MIEIFDGGTKIAEDAFPEAYCKQGGNPDDPRDWILPIQVESSAAFDGTIVPFSGPMTKWWYFDRVRNKWQAHEHIL